MCCILIKWSRTCAPATKLPIPKQFWTATSTILWKIFWWIISWKAIRYIWHIWTQVLILSTENRQFFLEYESKPKRFASIKDVNHLCYSVLMVLGGTSVEDVDNDSILFYGTYRLIDKAGIRTSRTYTCMAGTKDFMPTPQYVLHLLPGSY